MPRVYVVQEPSAEQNILPAEKFGELHVILTRSDIRQGTDHCVERLAYALRFMTDDDYLLPIGDPIMIGVATHLAFDRVHTVNFLRWSRNGYCYTLEHITL